MKDGYRIIKEEFDTITGITTVTINTDYGAFTGTVKLDDIDSKYPSIYHANELALAKALRKFAKQMVIITKEKIQPLRAVMNQCFYIDDHSSVLVWGKATFLIRREIEKLEKELSLWEQRIEVLSKSIEDRITARDRLVKSYLDKNK